MTLEQEKNSLRTMTDNGRIHVVKDADTDLWLKSAVWRGIH